MPIEVAGHKDPKTKGDRDGRASLRKPRKSDLLDHKYQTTFYRVTKIDAHCLKCSECKQLSTFFVHFATEISRFSVSQPK